MACHIRSKRSDDWIIDAVDIIVWIKKIVTSPGIFLNTLHIRTVPVGKARCHNQPSARGVKVPDLWTRYDPNGTFLRAFADQQLQPNVVFTARDADVIKTYVRMGMGVGVLAPMAILSEDLEDLNASCAKGLFPTVTTWIGVPRDRALRRYMLDFIALFAPNWPREFIELAAKADSQQIVDDLAAKVDLPTLSGCEQGVAAVA